MTDFIRSYQLAKRTFSCRIYPIAAPNGSTVIVCCHTSGVRILWRGGRRRLGESKQHATDRQVNGRLHREGPRPATSEDSADAFEDEEDETDPDCPYPSIIQDVDVKLDVEAQHLAIPALPTSALNKDDALRRHAAIALGCSDGSLRVLAFELSPPTAAGKSRYTKDILSRQLVFPHSNGPCTALTAKIVVAASTEDAGQTSSILLVSTASNVLHTYRFGVFNDLSTSENDAQVRTTNLPHIAKAVAFHPSATSTELLIVDISGAVRIYDPFASRSDSVTADNANDSTGLWYASFMSTYRQKTAGPARRKQILDVQWALSGKAILALLEDGEWGVWDLATSSQRSKSVQEFVLRGFLNASSGPEGSLGAHSKSSSRLAPMTPNTRKTKSETFFGGAPTAPIGIAHGGISVSSSSIRAGQTDESVVLWYNADVYSIPSLQQFWHRSTTNNSNSSNFGSLYAPGLTHITDINLMNESITSVSQFAASTANSGVGHMNTQRDLLVSGEHRLIISQTLRPPTPARQLFQQAMPERPIPRDQRMLDAGQLDIGGLDRMLDGMENSDGRSRRVGFAAS
jgi:hypothetical protein